jgi:predicted nucleotidyltransferase
MSTKVGTQHLIDEDDLLDAIRGVFATPLANDQVGHAVSEIAVPYVVSPPAASPAPTTLGDLRLPQIVGRIVRAVDPAQIILFGSRARGDAHLDSDFDLLVVLEEIGDRRATRIAIRRVLDDLPIAKDVIVATVDELSGRGGRPRGVLHWALTEGRVLYERA